MIRITTGIKTHDNTDRSEKSQCWERRIEVAVLEMEYDQPLFYAVDWVCDCVVEPGCGDFNITRNEDDYVNTAGYNIANLEENVWVYVC